jgi:hypothetical protein
LELTLRRWTVRLDCSTTTTPKLNCSPPSSIPIFLNLDQLLGTAHLDDPPTASQRRLLLAELATIFLVQRDALRLLATT